MGGSLSLCALLLDYREAVEADFHRVYGIELERTLGTRSLRWLLTRLKYLPPDAAVWRAQAQDQPTTPSNVVSIAEWVQKNQQQRKEVN